MKRNILLALVLPIIFISCKNTTDPQSSYDAREAKERNTLVADYSFNDGKTIKVKNAFIEKVWWYDNQFGSKTIDDSARTLYIELTSASIDLKSNIALYDTYNFQIGNDVPPVLFEDRIKGIRGMGDKLYLSYDLPDTMIIPKEFDFYIIKSKDTLERYKMYRSE